MQTANTQKPDWLLEMETILQMLSVCNDFTSEVTMGWSSSFTVERRQGMTHMSLPINSRPVYKSNPQVANGACTTKNRWSSGSSTALTSPVWDCGCGIP